MTSNLSRFSSLCQCWMWVILPRVLGRRKILMSHFYLCSVITKIWGYSNSSTSKIWSGTHYKAEAIDWLMRTHSQPKTQLCYHPTERTKSTRKHLPSNSGPTMPRNHQQPSPPCNYCGAGHFYRFCPVRKSMQRPSRQQKQQTASWKRRRKPWQPHSPKNPRPAQSPKSVGYSRNFARFQLRDAVHRQYVNVYINGMPTSLQLDTASEIAITSKREWRPLVSPSSSTLSS